MSIRKLLSIIPLLLTLLPAKAQEVPDTVKAGVYIISVHDIDFREKEYTARLWLWLRYKNPDFDFARNVEVPNAKSIEITDNFSDTSNGEIFTLMKLKCVMKQAWEVEHYPFDKQKLEVHIENSQYDARSLVFVPDTLGSHFDPQLTLSGWDIYRTDISTSLRAYETSFGDESLGKPHSEYASFNIDMSLERNAWGLFLKLFLGMYVAFLIAYISFFIHGDSIESRFGLSVGALFAAVGNKYIIDSLLPESSSFTLVDSLHAFTLVSIFIITLLSMYVLRITKAGNFADAELLDRRGARTLLAIYVLLNLLWISRAILS